MAKSSLPKKLLIKSKQRLIILNAPADFVEQLAPLPEGVEVATEPAGSGDQVHLFVRNRAELDQWLPRTLPLVNNDTIIWLSYPKGTSKVKTDLNRDILWKLMEPTGFRPVALVAIDDTWSAMRLRRAELVDTSRS